MGIMAKRIKREMLERGMKGSWSKYGSRAGPAEERRRATRAR